MAGPSLPAETGSIYGVDKFFDGAPRVTGKGDWQTVAAEENLRRGILRRMITTPGTYRTRPDYGVGMAPYVKKPITQAVIEELQNRTRAQVAQDRRVDKVLQVTVTKEAWGASPGLRVVVVVQALGRVQRPMNMLFKRTV